MAQAFRLNQVQGKKLFNSLSSRQKVLVNIIANLEVNRGSPSSLEDIADTIDASNIILNTESPMLGVTRRKDPSAPRFSIEVEELTDVSVLRRELKGLFEARVLDQVENDG
ncbi:hypothetical protein LCGC14_0421980 [marine sediment metagenome]|uniref:Uncharacterized protein n=1 Tax=marine sediment metagenome TaxID=412755 RepID=A0A0F9VZT0_9ZZZZ